VYHVEVLRLIAVDGPERGREIVVPPDGAAVGRGETCGIRLADGSVSREHFRLEVIASRSHCS
jgi:hypothetical protein